MRTRTGLVVIVAVSSLAVACDSGEQAGRFAGLSCSELAEDLQDEQVVMARTFGAGDDGAAAAEQISEAVAARPDCVDTLGADEVDAAGKTPSPEAGSPEVRPGR